MRHGRSAHPLPTSWITPGEFREWICIYNRIGISEDSHPSDELVATAADIPIVVCSDYPRSIESAARVAPNSQPRISATFREVGRPLQGNWQLRLPLNVWDRFSVLLWKFNLITSDEGVCAAHNRAQEATRALVSLARDSSRVLFVGHGMLNALIGRELHRQGWEGPRRTNDDYWGMASFRKVS